MPKSTKHLIGLIGFIILLIADLVYFAFVRPEMNKKNFIDILPYLEYRLGTSPLDANMTPQWILETNQDDKWRPIHVDRAIMDASGKDVLSGKCYWTRFKIPENKWKDCALFTLGRMDNTFTFFRGKTIQSIMSPENNRKHLSWYVFDLKDTNPGEYIYWHFPLGYNYSDFNGIYLGSFYEFNRHLLLKEIIPVAASLLFLIVGILAFIIFMQRYREPSVFGFAVFSILVGIFTLMRTDLIYLILPPEIVFNVFLVTMFFIPAASFYFAEVVLQTPCTSWIRKLWVINLSAAFLYLALMLIDINMFSITIMILYFILTITSITLSLILVLFIRNKSQEAMLFTAGYVIFSIFSLLDLLSNFTAFFSSVNLFWGMLWLVVIISKILYSRFSQTQDQLREYSQNLEKMVDERTNELSHANDELEETLSQLKGMQKQIIQQEKLASLGGLTAGIAHEIKNPLNFVNNFATVSIELLEELKDNLNQRDPVPLKEEDHDLISDLEQSIEKIHQHGKRADGIIQSMLLHSRGTAGEFRTVQLNQILDEYISLAYHGMRAQDSNFNITLDVSLDPGVKEVTVVPQDISRAFLNIVNNACYAAYDKKKTLKGDFEPRVSVKSFLENKGVSIVIRDNGNGIPVEIQQQVFDPFFTTKPAGEGTGLGLSISYDIIVNEHRGQLQLETVPGQFTEFRIWIPLKHSGSAGH